MTSVVMQIEKLNLCRCCHSEGTFTSVYSPCFSLGVEEVAYSDILRECFAIELIPVTELVRDLLCTICDNCIKRLRAAIVFKHQVKKCERMFRKIYLGQIINEAEPVTVKVKEEKPDAEEEKPLDVPIAYVSLSVKAQKDDDNDFEWPMDDSEVFDDMKPEDETNNECDSSKTQVKLEEDVSSQNDNLLMEITNNDKSDEEETLSNVAKKKRVAKRPTKAKGRNPKGSKTKEDGETSANEEKEADGEEESTSSSKNRNSSEKKKGKKRESRIQEGVHYRRETQNSKEVWLCCGCDREGSDDLVRLKIHIRKVHLKSPKYKCKLCDEQFMTLSPFTIHKYEKHNIDDRFKCNACDQVFNTKVQLRRHKNSFHMLGKRMKCSLCEYEAYSFERMYKHKFKHKTVKEFQCAYCLKTFLRRTTMKLHERIHLGDRRKTCKVCGQAFVQKASLNYHMNKYHPEVEF